MISVVKMGGILMSDPFPDQPGDDACEAVPSSSSLTTSTSSMPERGEDITASWSLTFQRQTVSLVQLRYRIERSALSRMASQAGLLSVSFVRINGDQSPTGAAIGLGEVRLETSTEDTEA
jgi:hypothetical protein